MKNKAYKTVKKYNMITKGDRIIVGLSGGADSCALLHFLVSIRKDLNLDIYACHINHGIRGIEADNDERFTESFCSLLGVKLFTLHADVINEAKKRGISTELCGREIRYDFFKCKSRELNAKIATAHTASDNVETVLFNLTRGSGIQGLCGIPPVRENIIRPLIEVSRDDIEQYCAENKIEYVTDSTNLTREYTRNKLRLDVVPILKEINPSLERTICGLSERSRQTYSYIRNTAALLLSDAKKDNGYAVEKLMGSDEAVFSEAIRIICAEYHIIPEARHIELIRKIVYNGGALEIKHGIFAASDKKIFSVYCRTDKQKEKCDEQIALQPGKILTINNKKINAVLINIEEFNNRKKIEKNLFDNSLDYDTIPLLNVFRTRRPGDFFSPLRRNVTKTLKKLFTEMKLSPEKRDELILLASESDVLWIEGIGVSDKYKITPDTRRVLVIKESSGDILK